MPTISFKVSAREAASIRRLARQAHQTVSEFLRRRATEPSPQVPAGGEYRIERSPTTGLPVMVAPPGVAPVTSEQVQALLQDFP
jgi:hypothetical protein